VAATLAVRNRAMPYGTDVERPIAPPMLVKA